MHLLTKHTLSAEQRWQLALGGAGLGVAEWKLQDDSGRTSPQWKRLTGSGSTALHDWLDSVHDDDQSALREALRGLRQGAQSRAQREIRVPAADGWRWLDAQLLVVERDHHGQALRLIATLSDSSERHDAQQRQRLSASLFQHMHEGLLVTDAELRVLDVNPAYIEILGGERENCWAPCRRCCARRLPTRWCASNANACGTGCAAPGTGAARSSNVVATARPARCR